MNAPVARHHDTFSRFQKTPGGKDLTGFVAYCLYKQDKIRWIELWGSHHAGQRPSHDEIEMLYIRMLTAERVEEFRVQAELIINEFADKMLGAELEAQRDAIRSDATIDTVRDELVRNGGFWRGVGQNLAANVVTSVLTFIAVAVLWAYTQAPQDFMQTLVMNAMKQQIQVVVPPEASKAN